MCVCVCCVCVCVCVLCCVCVCVLCVWWWWLYYYYYYYYSGAATPTSSKNCNLFFFLLRIDVCVSNPPNQKQLQRFRPCGRGGEVGLDVAGFPHRPLPVRTERFLCCWFSSQTAPSQTEHLGVAGFPHRPLPVRTERLDVAGFPLTSTLALPACIV